MNQRGFTMFDLFAISGTMLGVIFGARYGFVAFGSGGAVVGALSIGLLGFVIGRLPYAIIMARTKRQLTRESSARLRQRLRSGAEFYLSLFFLAALMQRGEDVADELPAILSLVQSTDPERQRVGKESLRLAFPDVAAKLDARETTTGKDSSS